MKLSITDIEGGKAQIVDFGAAFVLFFGHEALFGYDKAVFTLSFADSVRAENINGGSRLYWEGDPSLSCSHVDLTVSEYGNGIAFKIEAMHDCFLDIKAGKNTVESINERGEAFKLRIGTTAVRISGSCSLHSGTIRLRRGTSKLVIDCLDLCLPCRDDPACFKHEAHKINELIFNGKEISESDPLFPFLLLSEGLLRGRFDEKRKDSLYRMAKLLPKEERARALTAIDRYLRAFGMPALKERCSGAKLLNKNGDQ